MSVSVSSYRLREIRNIADSLGSQAAHYPVNRLISLVEKEYLKPFSHILIYTSNTMDIGETKTYTQVFQKKDEQYIRIGICFNGNLTTKDAWRKTAAALIKELGWIMFASEAAIDDLKIKNVKGRKFLIDAFVKEVIKNHPFAFKDIRPRFTLEMLKEIVEKDLHKEAKIFLPYMQKLLQPYLGPDGW